jgi:predicted nucleic acid-binding protein
MIVLDASVLIGHLDATDTHHAAATALLAAHADESLRISPVTLAEVLVGPARAGRLEAATGAVDKLAIQVVDLPSDGPARLATLRAAARAKMPDCCVLLAAQQTEGAVATFDDGLAKAARGLGLTVLGVVSEG